MHQPGPLRFNVGIGPPPGPVGQNHTVHNALEMWITPLRRPTSSSTIRTKASHPWIAPGGEDPHIAVHRQAA